ncbi:coiled-coil domain-containing protein 7 [Arvicola amphibius]|uniref:coiled-coil domain-containing protein 7 n=1 Tax=Arvicola amphibius TaxID=1047088 RepID=UPI001C0898D6|nr:coiled-coil domain-containing protein 7 [Arvicola amphibius]
MKRAQPLSTINKKLTSVPELPYQKGLLNSSPKPKEKRNAKSQYDKIEPMVLRSPPTGESVVRYALPIPSSKTKDLIAEDEMVRRITKHLKMVVTTLEDTYGTVDEDREKTLTEPTEEGVSLSVGDDMTTFLQYCSQFAAQIEEAVKEERNILESLFKWFQQQVNQMEEIGKDQSILEADLPSDDKTLNLNITQIVNLVHRFEDLKTRLKGHRGSLLSKHMEKDTLPDSIKNYEAIEKQIEEFIKSHSAYESQIASETEPAPYSVTKRMNVMMKIFENQTNMLERALNDQSIVETKYKQMETDFQMLLLEKTLLETEIQRMKESELLAIQAVSGMGSQIKPIIDWSLLPALSHHCPSISSRQVVGYKFCHCIGVPVQEPCLVTDDCSAPSLGKQSRQVKEERTKKSTRLEKKKEKDSDR